MHDGVHIGNSQAATGSHRGDVFGASNNYMGTTNVITGFNSFGQPVFQTDSNGNQVLIEVTESPGIDEPWISMTLLHTGMFFTETPIVDLGLDSNGNRLLDFSGWRMHWAGNIVDLGSGGSAVISCSNSSCSNSSTYTLDYFSTVPAGDPTGLGGLPFELHLEGHINTVTAVPVPTSYLLLSTGGVGLIAIARRRKRPLETGPLDNRS